MPAASEPAVTVLLYRSKQLVSQVSSWARRSLSSVQTGLRPDSAGGPAAALSSREILVSPGILRPGTPP